MEHLEHPAHVSVLGLKFVLPHPAAVMSQWAEVRPLVDGRDVLEEIHPEGVSSCSRRSLFRPVEEWPFAALDEPRKVELSSNDCVTACCGGVFVTIRRRGERVVWSGWQNTEDVRAPVPADVHFDAAQYNAELVRAAADVSWEEPVDSIARLLTLELAEADCFERWDCDVLSIRPQRAGSPRVEVYFGRRGAAWSPGSTFVHELPAAGGEPAVNVVRRFVRMVTDNDPRETARST
ncbi:hypothetical protein ACIF8W_07830 [Streptomyces sp. NPDC085639]|uniref:hypothetical protein n=1 Tax=Streptomyces sp. NPDC085639 TaxID=3365734 RepID=UPI0037D4D8C0